MKPSDKENNNKEMSSFLGYFKKNKGMTDFKYEIIKLTEELNGIEKQELKDIDEIIELADKFFWLESTFRKTIESISERLTYMCIDYENDYKLSSTLLNTIRKLQNLNNEYLKIEQIKVEKIVTPPVNAAIKDIVILLIKLGVLEGIDKLKAKELGQVGITKIIATLMGKTERNDIEYIRTSIKDYFSQPVKFHNDSTKERVNKICYELKLENIY